VSGPPNPDFERTVRESFARQSFMAALGASMEEVTPGRVTIAVPFSPALCQQNGYLHAGVLTSIADSACGYAALTLARPGHDVLAVEFKISLLRPARAKRFEARARVLRAGRTLTAAAADVYGLGVEGEGGGEGGGDREGAPGGAAPDSRAGEELVASMLSTVISRSISERS
jgi:uncharacterized protein (TIGR00369 family)